MAISSTYSDLLNLSPCFKIRIITCVQVFRKATQDAIELISALLEYTPTKRLSAIDAMVHPFFDELRAPDCRFPDSRHAAGATKEMPRLFDFSRHGRSCAGEHHDISNRILLELSISPELNSRLVPTHARKELASRGIDLDNFAPMSQEDLMAHLE